MNREDFWQYVDQSKGPGSCWPWTKGKGGWGYGYAKIDGTPIYGAHIAAYALSYPDRYAPTLFVLHKCDTPLCCNPHHLFQGTHADNMRDMIMKERGATQTFTAAEIYDILKMYQKGNRSQQYIADVYNSKQRTIADITSGRTWKHVYFQFYKDIENEKLRASN